MGGPWPRRPTRCSAVGLAGAGAGSRKRCWSSAAPTEPGSTEMGLRRLDQGLVARLPGPFQPGGRFLVHKIWGPDSGRRGCRAPCFLPRVWAIPGRRHGLMARRLFQSGPMTPCRCSWVQPRWRIFPGRWRCFKRRDGLGNLCEATAAIDERHDLAGSESRSARVLPDRPDWGSSHHAEPGDRLVGEIQGPCQSITWKKRAVEPTDQPRKCPSGVSAGRNCARGP